MVTKTTEKPAVPSVEQRVRLWVAQNLGGGYIARDVQSWNELQAALPALVQMIEEA